MADNGPDGTNYFKGWYDKSPGLGHVGAFQVSGTPWLTGSVNIDNGTEDAIKFPRVTKEIRVWNHGPADLRVHFASISPGVGNVSANHHYITLVKTSGSITLPIKCKNLYISNTSGVNNGRYDVYAELTSIDRGRMYALTGSGITE